ncbi:MAG: glycosyltransferase family 4 protein [Bacilli bacterium]|nr:glycosyltransferase family 4 protein [Bacilli bacterium]
MRIGIFTDTYTPFINGVTTSVVMLKNALEKKGHTVYIVTVNHEDLKFKYKEDEKIIRIPGVPIGIYDYRLTGIYPLKAINKIKKWDLDVIHSQTEFGVGTFARIIAKQFNIPLVHTYHTMYEDYIHYITKGYFNKSSKKLVEYFTLFYCDKTISELVVPTRKTYELFKKKYKIDRNIYIVPTGIEVERFYVENNKIDKNKARKKIGLDKDDFVILFVGRIGKEKNLDLLLTSMKSLLGVSKKIKLLIIGDGPDIDNYKNYVTKNNLDKNVIFMGKVPWEEITTYYMVANVFATASQTETQGLTVIEAMAASLPVVAIDDESFRNTVISDLNGIIFNNRREYKRAIVKLYRDRDYLNRLAKQARIAAESHSSKYFAEQILDVYKIAIKNKPKHKIPIIEKVHNLISAEGNGNNGEDDSSQS